MQNVTLPWRRQWHPTPVLLPGKSYGQRSLVGGTMLDLTSEEKNVAQFFCLLLGMDEENMAGNEEKSCCC